VTSHYMEWLLNLVPCQVSEPLGNAFYLFSTLFVYHVSCLFGGS